MPGLDDAPDVGAGFGDAAVHVAGAGDGGEHGAERSVFGGGGAVRDAGGGSAVSQRAGGGADPQEGTEAAAATSVEMRLTSAMEPMDRFEMICDRPFFFAIVDKETGAVLFMGSLVDPS